MRLAQDGVTLTTDQALTELFAMAGIKQSATHVADAAAGFAGPSIKNHGLYGMK
jgi:hypothetical protein